MKHLIKISIILIVLAVIALALKSISSKQPQIDETSTPSDKSLRIISLSPNITEILYSLDLGDNIVGVTTYCTTPAEAKTKTKVGSIMQPDFETIIALKPDIVFTTGTNLQTEAAERLNNLGIKACPERAYRLDEVYVVIDDIAEKCGISSKGTKLNNIIKDELTQISYKYKEYETQKVLFVIQREPLIVAGHGTYINDIFDVLGIENAVPETQNLYPQLGMESLLISQPDVILEITMSGGTVEEQTKLAKEFYGKWANLEAVKNDRVYVIDADDVARPGPSVGKAARIIAEVVFDTEQSRQENQ